VVIDPLERNPKRAEVLYMTPNGQLKPFEGGGQHRGKSTFLISLYFI